MVIFGHIINKTTKIASLERVAILFVGSAWWVWSPKPNESQADEVGRFPKPPVSL